jgi:hypothetical protein
MAVSEGPMIVDTPAVWLADDLNASTAWRHELSVDEIVEFDAALAAARSHSPELDLALLTPEHFPLPTLTALVETVRHQLVDGFGVMLIEGFPVERYQLPELRAIWWLFGLHVGTPVSQSWRGDVMGDVRDLGTGIGGATGRGYTSNQELSLHSDAADVTALFFLQGAKEGGATRLASSVAVHNEIIRRRPDVMELLYEPMTVSWQSNQPPGEQGWYMQPVYGRHATDVCCAYVPTNITLAAANVGAPPLRPEQHEAVGYVREVSGEPQFWIERTLPNGTMMFCNNHTVFHMRTEFIDWPEPERKRHLLRLWMSVPNGRQLPDTFAEYFGDISAGAVRGGNPSRDGITRFATT